MTTQTTQEQDLRTALEEAVTFLEMDEEAVTPGTDLYTWLKGTAAPILAAPPRPVDAERVEDALERAEYALTHFAALAPTMAGAKQALEAVRQVLASPTHSPDKAVTREGATWRPMKDVPADGKTQIVARHQPNDKTPHGWIATITIDPDDEDRRSGRDTIVHYNGERLMSGFHGMWTGWMYPEEFAVLAPKLTGTEAGRGMVPAGWKLVPEMSTEKMDRAGMDVAPMYPERIGGTVQHSGKRISLSTEDCREIYTAMLAATPTPPVSPSPDSTGQGDAQTQEDGR